MSLDSRSPWFVVNLVLQYIDKGANDDRGVAPTERTGGPESSDALSKATAFFTQISNMQGFGVDPQEVFELLEGQAEVDFPPEMRRRLLELTGTITGTVAAVRCLSVGTFCLSLFLSRLEIDAGRGKGGAGYRAVQCLITYIYLQLPWPVGGKECATSTRSSAIPLTASYMADASWRVSPVF